MLAGGGIPPSCLFAVKTADKEWGEMSRIQKVLNCTHLWGGQEAGGRDDQMGSEHLVLEGAARMLDEAF